jgi:hypothetical protein
VAELIGYRGFVPAAAPGSGDQAVAGVHPERVIQGSWPDRGLVLTGVVAVARPAGAGWEADVRVGDALITCRLPDRPPDPGGEAVVTVLDPPYFGADGGALPAVAVTSASPAQIRP